MALNAWRHKSTKQFTEVKSEWAQLTTTYDIKMRVKAPFTYWKGKQRQHRRSARKWMGTMVVTFLVAVAWIFLVATTFGPVTENGIGGWFSHIVYLGIPAFIAVWAGRLANRQLSDQLIRAEDAGERAVMVRTVLALARQGTTESLVPEAQIAMLLQAIFRPGPGLSSDDSPAIGIAEIIAKSLHPDSKR